MLPRQASEFALCGCSLQSLLQRIGEGTLLFQDFTAVASHKDQEGHTAEGSEFPTPGEPKCHSRFAFCVGPNRRCRPSIQLYPLTPSSRINVFNLSLPGTSARLDCSNGVPCLCRCDESVAQPMQQAPGFERLRTETLRASMAF